jgi:hypothetical protein
MKIVFAAVLMTSTAMADAVTDWNAIMRATINAQNPLAQARFAAITHLAVFEAVNAITRDYKPYLGTITAPAGASPDAAAVAAAHRVLRTYFPGNAASLDADEARSLAMIPDSVAKTNGILVGEAAAAAMIALRANDGSAAQLPYAPVGGVGFWQPTPPAFSPGMFLHWGRVTPFGMVRPDQFRPKPPPALTSSQYKRDYNEVKEVGNVNSTARPQDRSDVARFAAATSPVQLWNPVALQVGAAERTSLSENARVFALLNMAMCDASIAVFEAKYFYHFWRPVTAIRAGDTDGNPRTEPGSDFTPFVTTPLYPSYPSGHGGLSNAARYVLERIFGSGRQSTITLSNPALPDVTLRYTKFRQITDDMADARVYGGIHFRFEQDEAELLGRRVARYVQNSNLRCLQADRCADAEDENDQ